MRSVILCIVFALSWNRTILDNKTNWTTFFLLCFAQKLYEEMKNRIELVMESGKIPDGSRKQHKGFAEWNLSIKKQDHQSIVQVMFLDIFFFSPSLFPSRFS